MGLMAHLTIFLKILAISFGIAAIILLSQHYTKYKYKYLIVYSYIVGFEIFIVIMTLGLFYIFTNLSSHFSSQTALIVETIYWFFNSPPHFLLCYLYVLLYWNLMGKEVPTKYIHFFWIVGGLLFAIVLFFSLYSILTSNVMPVINISVSIMLLSYCFNIGILIMLHQKAPTLQNIGKQIAIYRFSRVILIPYIIAMLIFFLHMLDFVFHFHLLAIFSYEVFVIFYFVFHMALFGFPIFYLKRFMKMYHGVLKVAIPDMEKQLGKLLDKYNISKREREVLQLVCEGKTNKQIEEHLYISLQTVKDHVSNIYRKTGVNNRVQLINLFRFSVMQSDLMNR